MLSRRICTPTSATPYFSSTVSASGISPQNDHVSSLGSAAGMFSGRPLALRCSVRLPRVVVATDRARCEGD